MAYGVKTEMRFWCGRRDNPKPRRWEGCRVYRQPDSWVKEFQPWLLVWLVAWVVLIGARS